MASSKQSPVPELSRSFSAPSVTDSIWSTSQWGPGMGGPGNQLQRLSSMSSLEALQPQPHDSLVASRKGLVVRIFDAGTLIPADSLPACNHVKTVKASHVLSNRPGGTDPDSAVCSDCQNDEEVWLCMVCGKVACGRGTPKQHMIQHHRESGHCVVMSMRDLSCYCYACKHRRPSQHPGSQLARNKQIGPRAHTERLKRGAPRKHALLQPQSCYLDGALCCCWVPTLQSQSC